MACDVPSHLYSYSFDQRLDWSRLCSHGGEILRYLQEVARDQGVEALIEPSQRVTVCSFYAQSSRWEVEVEGGRRYEADVVVLATGQLNRRSIPVLAGLDRFAGHSFHSARWDHDYDLAGKRAAVVGTGASAVQFVSQIAPRVERMTVFQRTGNWMLPRKVYSPALRKLIVRVPAIHWLRRTWMFNYCEALTVTIRHPRTVGRLLALRSRMFMHRQLPDRELRAKAMPDYTFGCKRVLSAPATFRRWGARTSSS